MINLIYRLIKGTPLTNAEVDSNFSQLAGAVQPAGGTAGQILAKVDGTDYNSGWVDNFALAVKVYVKNTTGATITKGSAVYISGAAGANAFISLAKADAEATSSKTLGLVETDIANNGFGYVFREGVLSGLNTSAAAEGDPIWLSPTTAGGLLFGVANKPVAPAHMVYLGMVTRSHASVGEIQIRVQNGYELDELHDMLIGTKADKDMLSYDAATGVWKNYTAADTRTRLDVSTTQATQDYATAMAIALG